MSDGIVRITVGDPRYCWNPYRHDAHDFAYTLDDEQRIGRVWCDGDGRFAATAMAASFRDIGGIPCPTCRGTGDLGGEVNGAPYGCDSSTPLPSGTPICDGTGVWKGQTMGASRG